MAVKCQHFRFRVGAVRMGLHEVSLENRIGCVTLGGIHARATRKLSGLVIFDPLDMMGLPIVLVAVCGRVFDILFFLGYCTFACHPLWEDWFVGSPVYH